MMYPADEWLEPTWPTQELPVQQKRQRSRSSARNPRESSIRAGWRSYLSIINQRWNTRQNPSIILEIKLGKNKVNIIEVKMNVWVQFCKVIMYQIIHNNNLSSAIEKSIQINQPGDALIIHTSHLEMMRWMIYLGTCWGRRTTSLRANHPREIAGQRVDGTADCSNLRPEASSNDPASHVSNSPQQNGNSSQNLTENKQIIFSTH